MPKPCCKESFDRIPEDVPVFTLVGYDKLAIETVEFWLRRAREEGVNTAKLTRSREHLADMMEFALSNQDRMKLPD